MIIHEFPQRSPEWFAIRRGKITASQVGMFVANASTQKAKDARQNLIDKLLGEMADGEDTAPSYEDYWMKRGTLLEPESISAYESATGHEVYHVGFIEHDTLPIGCSPDGMLVGMESGIEGKAVKGSTQIRRIRENVLPAEYVCQIHHSMIVCNAPWWDFWSYHPNLPPFRIRTYRDGFTDQLEAGLHELCADMKRQGAKLNVLYKEAFERAKQ